MGEEKLPVCVNKSSTGWGWRVVTNATFVL